MPEVLRTHCFNPKRLQSLYLNCDNQQPQSAFGLGFFRLKPAPCRLSM